MKRALHSHTLHVALGLSLVWLAPGCRGTPEAARRAPEVYYQPPAATPVTATAVQPSEPASKPVPGCKNDPGQIFPRDAPWNSAVAGAIVASDSAQIIAFLEKNHTAETRFQVDFSFVQLEAQAATPRQTFVPTADHFTPDCDSTPVPIVAGGRVEGERGYGCLGNGDCHLLVLERSECRLYEMWRADLRGTDFRGGCLAVWDIGRVYPDTGRGEYCTSADAAGLPIAPFLFSADDVANGEIRHALRFILPNALIRRLTYVRPGTHSTKATTGPDQAPPYASRLRLKPDVNLEGLKPAAQVVARALKAYGMVLADGGQVTFTALGDDLTTTKWATVDFGAHDLKSLRWTDFEVVDSGPRFAWRSDCLRQPITN